jgi:hypothetical protein
MKSAEYSVVCIFLLIPLILLSAIMISLGLPTPALSKEHYNTKVSLPINGSMLTNNNMTNSTSNILTQNDSNGTMPGPKGLNNFSAGF